MFSSDDAGQTVRRDRREHGGASTHPDDDALARRTETARVQAGVDSYDPDDVPAATDTAQAFDITETEEYLEQRAEINRQASEGERYALTEKHPFPPTRYDK